MKNHIVILVTLSLLFSMFLYPVSISLAQKNYNEAPMLNGLVKQGKLPRIEQRLPSKPVIVKPLEEVGQYGGTMYYLRGGNLNFLHHAPLIYLDEKLKGLLPELADRWQMSSDGRTFTIHIRQGVKWSDGEPFTTEDVVFKYEDIILNKELTPQIPTFIRNPGSETPAQIKKVDTYTFQIIFEKPYPLFLYTLAYTPYSNYLYLPKHYLSKFHPKYVDKSKLEAAAKGKGYDTWYKFFSYLSDPRNNPELPVLSAWKLKEPPSTVQLVFERNPYYYKVDTVGNQLPYIDRIILPIIPSVDTFLMKAMSGDLDFVIAPIPLSQFTVLKENEAKGGYRVLLWDLLRGGEDGGTIYINQNVKDPILRKLFQDKKFRTSLSMAINRNEIWKICFLGFGKPRQLSIPSGAPLYDPNWEKAYIEYNPAKANKLLDEIGLNRRDKDGFRLRPDGKTLAVTIEFPSWIDSTPYELVKGYWEAIGIKIAIRGISDELFYTRNSAGETEIGAGYSALSPATWLRPDTLLGIDYAARPWAPLWAQWFLSEGKSGEEPPAEVKQIYKLWEEMVSTTNRTQRDSLFKKICNIHRENIWLMGLVGEVPRIVIVNNRLRNVPERDTHVEERIFTASAHPEQWFLKDVK